MGTNCTVSVRCSDGNLRGIYCNYDGYPSHMLSVLKHYDTQLKAEELVSFGDARSLYSTLEECVFYHRDNQEPFEVVKPCKEEILYERLFWNKLGKGQYNYIFENNEWKLLNN